MIWKIKIVRIQVKKIFAQGGALVMKKQNFSVSVKMGIFYGIVLRIIEKLTINLLF